MKVTDTDTHAVKELVNENVKYDLIGKLVEANGLTCRVIVTILQKISPNTFYLFRANPKEFIIKAGNIINQCKAIAVIDTWHTTNSTRPLTLIYSVHQP